MLREMMPCGACLRLLAALVSLAVLRQVAAQLPDANSTVYGYTFTTSPDPAVWALAADVCTITRNVRGGKGRVLAAVQHAWCACVGSACRPFSALHAVVREQSMRPCSCCADGRHP